MNKHMVLAIAGIALILLAVVAATLLSGPERGPDFSQYEAGPERKQAFFSYFLPIVQKRNAEILETRKALKDMRADGELSSPELRKVRRIADDFGMDEFTPAPEDWAKLMRRVDVVPASLALAQAANESAWGTSRFAREGNNYFGQWCFEVGCGIVPNRRDEGKTHEVAAFDSPAESVATYMANLNRHNAYRELRSIRASLRQEDDDITGIQLAAGLRKYSERGDEYISELRSMIRYNKLSKYDDVRFAAVDAPPTSG